jgi:large subunit ribosomal protein L9
VADAIGEVGFVIERRQVSLDHPIKTLGVHNVKITLHPEVSLVVKVNVAQSADEAAAQAKGLTAAEIGAAREAAEVEPEAETATEAEVEA